MPLSVLVSSCSRQQYHRPLKQPRIPLRIHPTFSNDTWHLSASTQNVSKCLSSNQQRCVISSSLSPIPSNAWRIGDSALQNRPPNLLWSSNRAPQERKIGAGGSGRGDAGRAGMALSCHGSGEPRYGKIHPIFFLLGRRTAIDPDLLAVWHIFCDLTGQAVLVLGREAQAGRNSVDTLASSCCREVWFLS